MRTASTCPQKEEEQRRSLFSPPSRTENKAVSLGKTAPVLAIELRLPMLNPKLSAQLTMLAPLPCCGLVACPGHTGGALQYGCDEASLRRSFRPRGEDVDAAEAVEFGPPKRKRITSVCVDGGRGVLWVGDGEGWVTGYTLAPAVGTPPRRPAPSASDIGWQWQAHRIGHVSAICISPATGDVWTGSSGGHIRVWPLGMAAPTGHMPSGRSGFCFSRCGGVRPIWVFLVAHAYPRRRGENRAVHPSMGGGA